MKYLKDLVPDAHMPLGIRQNGVGLWPSAPPFVNSGAQKKIKKNLKEKRIKNLIEKN